jgi:acetyl esterase/lipase
MIRREMARFEYLMARHVSLSASPPVDLGHCSGTWFERDGLETGRVILYLHGGAFIAESPVAHGAMLTRLCRKAKARGFYVSYRLAPEHPYPAATDDCLAAYRFLLAQGIDPARIVIAGDSAGGNLAVVTALRARDAGLPMPAALVALSPVLDGTFSGDSIRRNDGLDPLFRRSVVDALANVYAPAERLRDPYVSPLFADLSSLPPSLLIVGSSEILLDDSTRFASRAGNATLQVWHGMPHVFPLLPELAEGEEALEGVADFIVARTVAPPAGNTGSPPQAS